MPLNLKLEKSVKVFTLILSAFKLLQSHQITPDDIFDENSEIRDDYVASFNSHCPRLERDLIKLIGADFVKAESQLNSFSVDIALFMLCSSKRTCLRDVFELTSDNTAVLRIDFFEDYEALHELFLKELIETLKIDTRGNEYFDM